jgi:hypothetical protein
MSRSGPQSCAATINPGDRAVGGGAAEGHRARERVGLLSLLTKPVKIDELTTTLEEILLPKP